MNVSVGPIANSGAQKFPISLKSKKPQHSLHPPLRFHPELASYIAALKLNPEYVDDRRVLTDAPIFFADAPHKWVNAQRIRGYMAKARVPSFSRWHLAEAVRVVLVKQRQDKNTTVLKALRDTRFLTLRLNPSADKETMLREVWARIKNFQKRGHNQEPTVSKAILESDGSILVEVDITATRVGLEKLLWAAIQPLRPNRATRFQRGHANSLLDDLAVLRMVKEGSSLHVIAKEFCRSSVRAIDDPVVDKKLQSLKRARARAERLVRKVYVRS